MTRSAHPESKVLHLWQVLLQSLQAAAYQHRYLLPVCADPHVIQLFSSIPRRGHTLLSSQWKTSYPARCQETYSLQSSYTEQVQAPDE